jgi:hypothetical protein
VAYPIVKETDGETESSYLGLIMTVKPHHFSNGHLKIRCSASIHNIYYQSTEKSVEEERPRGPQHVTSTMGGSVPYIPPPSLATDLPPSGHRFDPDTVIGKGNFLQSRCFYSFGLFSASYHCYHCCDDSRYITVFRINHSNLS